MYITTVRHPYKLTRDISWLYTLFLMLDANFRAKCKARGLDDLELGSGWSYFVEETAYQAHLAKYGEQTEVRTARVAQVLLVAYSSCGVYHK